MATKEVQKAQVSAIDSPNKLLEIAVSKDVDIDKLERLINMQVDWEKRQARKLYYEAMSLFQKNCPVIKKSNTVDFSTKNGRTKYNFAGFDSLIFQLREIIADHGFSYRFEHKVENNLIKVGCIVTHKEGHSEETWMEGTPDTTGNKNEIQQRGSTFSYLKRYSFTGAFGIATSDKDDDGQASKPKVTDNKVQKAHDNYMNVYEEALNIVGNKLDQKFHPDNWSVAFKDRGIKHYEGSLKKLREVVNIELDKQEVAS